MPGYEQELAKLNKSSMITMIYCHCQSTQDPLRFTCKLRVLDHK